MLLPGNMTPPPKSETMVRRTCTPEVPCPPSSPPDMALLGMLLAGSTMLPVSVVVLSTCVALVRLTCTSDAKEVFCASCIMGEGNPSVGFRVQGFRVYGVGFRTPHTPAAKKHFQDIRFRVESSWFMVYASGFRLLYQSTLGLRVIKQRRRVWLVGCRALLHHKTASETYPDTPGIGTVLNLRTNTSQRCAAVPRRARVECS